MPRTLGPDARGSRFAARVGRIYSSPFSLPLAENNSDAVQRANMQLVSVIVTTFNSQRTLAACLQSIRSQTHANLELIVVDNYSYDTTFWIAQQFANIAVQGGPERSSQRNLGASIASGDFILIVDSDMVLNEDVVEKCLDAFNYNKSILAIPEQSFGVGFWAECKTLERSFYLSDSTTAAARFFERWLFLSVGGYDERLHAAEDWDLSIRLAQHRPLRFADSRILHDEGALALTDLARKKFYYGTSLRRFLAKHGKEARMRLSPMRPSLIANLSAITKTPVLGAGLIVMKSAELIAVMLGVLFSAFTTKNAQRSDRNSREA
jgi:glycosyltransferase involved in cell wall biosynthesis